jgi:hypothetical protein
METRPTKSEIGKTQKIVEALQGFVIKTGQDVEGKSHTKHRDR